MERGRKQEDFGVFAPFSQGKNPSNYLLPSQKGIGGHLRK
jgi:hypothetical protein